MFHLFPAVPGSCGEAKTVTSLFSPCSKLPGAVRSLRALEMESSCVDGGKSVLGAHGVEKGYNRTGMLRKAVIEQEG